MIYQTLLHIALTSGLSLLWAMLIAAVAFLGYLTGRSVGWWRYQRRLNVLMPDEVRSRLAQRDTRIAELQRQLTESERQREKMGVRLRIIEDAVYQSAAGQGRAS
jgi:hypothetical protein